MTSWKHKHVIDLSSFSVEDYQEVLSLAHRFKALPSTGTRKLPALQGRLVTTLFFEPSTRTRSSFELAARSLSADVQNFSPSASSIKKGESILDTALTYVSMGADVLVVRHGSTNVAAQIAYELEKLGENTAVLNAGDGLHSHPSQGLLDLYTLAHYFNPEQPKTQDIKGKTIAIVGDILHSRVARSNLWALTACGADVILCGPESLLPKEFESFVKLPPPGQTIDPIKTRGCVHIVRNLSDALVNADAVMTLRVQKERMRQNLLSSLDRYHNDFGITHDSLKVCKKTIPVLHPGPVNRGVEMSGELLNDRNICLAEQQVKNGIPTRMALLYLIAATEPSKLNA